jgi:hypothetical protein
MHLILVFKKESLLVEKICQIVLILIQDSHQNVLCWESCKITDRHTEWPSKN